MPSARVTAPVLTLSQSSSVLGRCSTTPLAVVSHQTASKMLSATGSIMFFISSLTETTGVISPKSGGAPDEEPTGAGFEQTETVRVARKSAPARETRRPPRLIMEQLSAGRPNGNGRPAELCRIRRDVWLNLGQREVIPSAQPRIRPLERHHHARDRPVVREVDLRRHAAHRGIGVPRHARQQARRLVEVERRNQTGRSRALDDTNIDAVERRREADAPVGQEILDPSRECDLGVELGALERASRPRILLDDGERQQEVPVAAVEGSGHVAFLLVDDRGELIGSLRVDFRRVALADDITKRRAGSFGDITRQARQARGTAERFYVFVEDLVSRRLPRGRSRKDIGRFDHRLAVYSVERWGHQRALTATMAGPARDDLAPVEVVAIDG